MLITSPLVINNEADAGWKSEIKKNEKKMKEGLKEMEESGECSTFNLKMAQEYSKKGKIWISNPKCDLTEQYIYDDLNGITSLEAEIAKTNDQVQKVLFYKAYNIDANSGNYIDDNDNDDDNNKKKKENKDKDKDENDLEDINKKLSNLFD